MAAAVTTQARGAVAQLCRHGADGPTCSTCEKRRRWRRAYRAQPEVKAKRSAEERRRVRRRLLDEDYLRRYRERARARTRRYVDRHREECRRKSAEWWRAHPDYARDAAARRLARMRAAEIGEVDLAALRLRCGGACYLCGTAIMESERGVRRLRESLDHIAPLGVGGHTLDNLALVHQTCNSVKRRRCDVRAACVPADLRRRCEDMIARARREVVA